MQTDQSSKADREPARNAQTDTGPGDGATKQPGGSSIAPEPAHPHPSPSPPPAALVSSSRTSPAPPANLLSLPLSNLPASIGVISPASARSQSRYSERDRVGVEWSRPSSASSRPLSKVEAATKIQASFRGHRTRRKLVATSPHQHLFPYTGPLAPHTLPPRKAFKNPVYTLTTGGINGLCGWPSPSNNDTIAFSDDPHAFPPQLIGIYTPQGWSSLVMELNQILNETHLPLCPAGLMWLIPIFGLMVFVAWSNRLFERRCAALRSRLHDENVFLQRWGLHWYCAPIETVRNTHGRGESTGMIIELCMQHVKPASPIHAMVEAKKRELMAQMKLQTPSHASMTRNLPAVSTPLAGHGNGNGNGVRIQVQAVAGPGPGPTAQTMGTGTGSERHRRQRSQR